MTQPGLAPAVLILTAAVGAASPAAAQDRTLAELFRAVDPAVVEIAAVQAAVPQAGTASRFSAGNLGSGFLISGDGRIMTASHVVQVADEVAVRFVNGEVVAARVLASDPGADVALIRAESVPAGIDPARLGNSDEAAVGDRVFVIGAPFGVAHSLSVGHISARRVPSQLFGGFEPVEMLQTDAAINQGNSGGPMFNMNGEVIGVVSHILSSSGGFEGLGFVITSNLAMRVLLDEPTQWTGLDGVLVDGPLARALNLPQAAGILVQSVAAGSPASALGLRPGSLPASIADRTLTLGGDIILAVHGIRIGEPDFQRRIRERSRSLVDSDTLEIQVLRDGQVVPLEATVGLLTSD
jgi:S1-C subfamily serine protease